MAEDRFANIATLQITQTGANVISFSELRTNVGIASNRQSGIAMIIDEIDYMLGFAALQEMTTANDRIEFGLSISNAVDDLADITDRRVLHAGSLLRTDQGTAASAKFHKQPFSYQFFPPIITAERSLYLGMDSTGLASAGVLRCRIYYRTVELTQGQFLELAEVFRLVG